MADHAPDDQMIPRAKAEAALAIIVQYLREQEDARDTEAEIENWDDDPPHWNDAAEWSDQLLRAANRDGHCGCRLCRS